VELRKSLVDRRGFVAGAGALAAGLAAGTGVFAQDAKPDSSPDAGPWTYTDVLGNTVELPARPIRIAANLTTAAALWELGIYPVAVFDWTASAYPDGDHFAWGSIDVDAVVNVGDIDGNIIPEDLINTNPDIVLTLTYDRDDPDSTLGIVADIWDAVNTIAPVLVVTDMDSAELQLERLVTLAAALGADLESDEAVAVREEYEAKVEEFREVAQKQSALQVLFIDVDPDALYIAGPEGVSELLYLKSLGLNFGNADSELKGEYWETLSLEEALKYPADVIFNDIYSTVLELEDLQEMATIGFMPAIQAGQVGLWERDFPVSYSGLTHFLETILATLAPAVKLDQA